MVRLSLVLMLFTSSCACFSTRNDEYNSPKCVAARKAVACSEKTLIALRPLVPIVVAGLMMGTPIDWEVIVKNAGHAQKTKAICLAAEVEKDFRSLKPSAVTFGANYRSVEAVADKVHDDVVKMTRAMMVASPVVVRLGH